MNIFEIEKSFLAIFEELEDNDGELTPELEEKLNITQEEFRTKVSKYIGVIKNLENELNLIKSEQKRIKDLYDRKEKTINRINNIIIDAINKFGDTSKSGSKFVDYGLGKVTVKTTKSINLEDSSIKEVVSKIKHNLEVLKENNQVDTINEMYDDSLHDINQISDIPLNDDDLKNIRTNISYNVSLYDLIKENGYSLVKQILREDGFDIKPNISKTNIKEFLSDSNNTLNIATVKENKSLIIK